MLIKSFEGFRPRAIRREQGGWIIGYGHTLSAREGATVSEADAELLLRYDLLDVEKSVNETTLADLNQHQFDALVSFAFSVGAEAFAASDVRQRLNAGAAAEAADAMMGWPEPVLPEPALRRRVAERALFVANPAAPVALSDLLSAPLPPPVVPLTPEEAPTEAESEKPPVEEAVVEEAGVEEAVVEEAMVEEAPTEQIAAIDTRHAAVAALLGEAAAPVAQPDPEPTIIPRFNAPQAAVPSPSQPPSPSNDNPPSEALSTTDAPMEEASPASPVEDQAREEPSEDAASSVSGEVPVPAADDREEASADSPIQTASSEVASVEAAPADPRSIDNAVIAAARYAPYSAVMIGPLPYLQAATLASPPIAPVIDHAVTEQSAAAAEAPGITDEPAEADLVVAEPLVIEPDPVVAVDPAPNAELILTSPEDAPEPAVARALWTPEQRDEPDGSENNLFGEDLTLTLGGSVMRHEMDYEAPAKFDWKETAPFIFMGGVGLVSFGASMAAFRRAAEQSGGSELTVIGWVLALIGLGCVGVSSINLYRKFGLPGGD